MSQMVRTRRIVILASALLVLGFGYVEIGHWVRFGHFPAFGLHADLVVRKADYGIDGVTKAYKAQLTNYGIIPRRVEACDFIDDTLSHRTQIGYTVEKWDASIGRWQSIFDKAALCDAYSVGTAEMQGVTKRLWPGQSISTVEEATAARDVFAMGDRARFVVFASADLTLPTAAFSIDERPERASTPYRVRH